MVYSHSGIVTEMYDHTNMEMNHVGFTGFLNGGAVVYDQVLRKELVIKQLVELLGDEIKNYSYYADKIWDVLFAVLYNNCK